MGGVFAIFAVLMIAGIVFWVWALIDCIRVSDDSMYQSGNKLIWVLVIVLAGWLGAIIYLIVGRPRSRAVPMAPGAGSGGLPPPPPP